MKTLKEFLEHACIELCLVWVCFVGAIGAPLALSENKHPTTDQIFFCWFMVALLVIVGGFCLWTAIDDFRNRVR